MEASQLQLSASQAVLISSGGRVGMLSNINRTLISQFHKKNLTKIKGCKICAWKIVTLI
jgi:hypothetical protein